MSNGGAANKAKRLRALVAGGRTLKPAQVEWLAAYDAAEAVGEPPPLPKAKVVAPPIDGVGLPIPPTQDTAKLVSGPGKTSSSAENKDAPKVPIGSPAIAPPIDMAGQMAMAGIGSIGQVAEQFYVDELTDWNKANKKMGGREVPDGIIKLGGMATRVLVDKYATKWGLTEDIALIVSGAAPVYLCYKNGSAVEAEKKKRDKEYAAVAEENKTPEATAANNQPKPQPIPRTEREAVQAFAGGA